jgi:hypothetical protein
MSEPKHGGRSAAATLPLASALEGSLPLARLMQRLRESRERFAAIRGQLPAALADQVRPGPLDDAGWSLLVSNGAVAAKLRQLVPALEDALRTQGWPNTAIRIKVQAGTPHL